MPDNTSTLSSAQMTASAREHWQTLGLDVAAFDAAMSGTPPAAPPAPAGGPSTPPAPTGEGTAGGISLTPAQAAELADALLAAGTPKDRVAAAHAADGLDPIQPDPTPEDQAQALNDANWGYDRTPAPEDFKIDYSASIAQGADLEAIGQFDALAKEFLVGLRMPVDLGAGIVERGQAVGAELARMDDASRQLWIREQRYVAEKQAGGPEQLAERIRLAGEVLKQAPGQFRDAAFAAHWFDDAWTLMTLANEGARLEAWREGSKKSG